MPSNEKGNSKAETKRAERLINQYRTIHAEGKGSLAGHGRPVSVLIFKHGNDEFLVATKWKKDEPAEYVTVDKLTATAKLITEIQNGDKIRFM